MYKHDYTGDLEAFWVRMSYSVENVPLRLEKIKGDQYLQKAFNL